MYATVVWSALATGCEKAWNESTTVPSASITSTVSRPLLLLVATSWSPSSTAEKYASSSSTVEPSTRCQVEPSR